METTTYALHSQTLYGISRSINKLYINVARIGCVLEVGCIYQKCTKKYLVAGTIIGFVGDEVQLFVDTTRSVVVDKATRDKVGEASFDNTLSG